MCVSWRLREAALETLIERAPLVELAAQSRLRRPDLELGGDQRLSFQPE